MINAELDYRIEIINNKLSIKIKKERIEKENILLKEEQILNGMLEGKKVRYLKGCPICGSSKTKKIQKRAMEYIKPRKWTDSILNKIQIMYKIKYECRQCGHIWIEVTKYRF